MGFISRLKELFNKNIECGEISSHIVFAMPKKKYLYLNKNIYVTPNTACVIVYKYRVCDVIFEGKHRINESSIPETYSRAKIEKLNSRGRRPKKIRADIYYVNLKEFNMFPYESDEPFCVKSGTLGKVKGYIEGICTVRVLDAMDLIRALINETGKEKNKDVNNDIGLWIGNKINALVEKNKIPTNQILSEQESVERLLNTYMVDALDKIGLVVSNVKLKAVTFPKKFQNKINEYMLNFKKDVKPIGLSTNFGGTSSPEVKVSVELSRNEVSSEELSDLSATLKKPAPKEQKVSSFKICKFCKKYNDASAKICTNCGHRL